VSYSTFRNSLTGHPVTGGACNKRHQSGLSPIMMGEEKREGGGGGVCLSIYSSPSSHAALLT